MAKNIGDNAQQLIYELKIYMANLEQEIKDWTLEGNVNSLDELEEDLADCQSDLMRLEGRLDTFALSIQRL